MKKIILAIAITLISSSSFAQVSDSRRERLLDLERDLSKIKSNNSKSDEIQRLAGLELEKYANHEYIGDGLALGAGVLYVIGSKMVIRGNYTLQNTPWNDPLRSDAFNKIDNGEKLCSLSTIFALAGAIYKIEAPIHIKKAGLILSGDGVGLRIKIN
jgi:hypothetical protein